MNIKQTLIQISRDKNIEESRSVAIIRLNQMKHYPGQPVMVAYLDSDNSERIVFAIGIKEGTGPDCYRLADIGGVIDVEDVDSSLPDSSDLVHGEVYVSKNDSGNWCFVNLGSDKKTREIKEIEEESYIFRSIKTGHKWFFNKKTQSCKRDDEFY